MSGQKSETPVVARALDEIAVRFPGAKYWRANSGGNKSGHRCNGINLVDVVGWQRFGMALAIEVKTESGQLTDEQYAFLDDVHRRGGYAGLYTPSGLFRFVDMPDKHMTPQQRVRHGGPWLESRGAK